MNKCECKRVSNVADKSGNEITLPFNVIQYLPDDYETCWDCGYDHEYESDYARRYHLAHMECQTRDEKLDDEVCCWECDHGYNCSRQ